MILIAILAVGMSVARWYVGLGLVYGVAVLSYPLLYLPNREDRARRLRPDAKRAGLGYLAGVIGPVVCLVFDPFVFRDPFPTGSPSTMLGASRAGCYTFMTLEMILITLWLRAGPAFGPASGLLSGAFYAGAVYALGIGLLLLPMSAVGLIVGIGLLGLIPFLTAYAFLLQGRLAATLALTRTKLRPVIALQIAGATLVAGVSVAAHLLFE
jgi:hypothetical protein